MFRIIVVEFSLVSYVFSVCGAALCVSHFIDLLSLRMYVSHFSIGGPRAAALPLLIAVACDVITVGEGTK